MIRSKCYSLLTEGRQINKCKGGKKEVVDDLNFSLYKSVLQAPQLVIGKQLNLRSFSHNIYKIETNKIYFSSFDDK